MIKVLLVDDHDLFRDSLKMLIEQDKEICVVACAHNGNEALELCKQHQPDIVLMDILMPDCDGVKGVRLIKENFPDIKVVMLTSLSDEYNISQALMNGADGYLSKNLRGEELIKAIKSTDSGLVAMEQDTLNTLVKKIDSKGLESQKEDKKLDIELSDRERELIRLLVEGLSNKEIASHFKMSEGSVKNNISQLLKRFGLESRVNLVVYAVRNGLV
ncbi:MAG: Transcriptional regulatory protein DegU [Firmicutes bacterium ADurb.Bin419]|nr:MAG: Transcriptional regulatory protein DegU [Firmicutes bacterium ADurb.Bin419]